MPWFLPPVHKPRGRWVPAFSCPLLSPLPFSVLCSEIRRVYTPEREKKKKSRGVKMVRIPLTIIYLKEMWGQGSSTYELEGERRRGDIKCYVPVRHGLVWRRNNLKQKKKLILNQNVKKENSSKICYFEISGQKKKKKKNHWTQCILFVNNNKNNHL